MARKPQDNPALDMTPMIDVVFELIIFFVVTIQQQDILSKMNVNKPAPADSKSSSTDKDDDLTEIEVGRHVKDYRGNFAQGVYVMKGTEMTLDQISEYLRSIAKKSAKPEELPIVIKCTEDSPHGALVRLLDRCYENKLFSISLFSM